MDRKREVGRLRSQRMGIRDADNTEGFACNAKYLRKRIIRKMLKFIENKRTGDMLENSNR